MKLLFLQVLSLLFTQILEGRILLPIQMHGGSILPILNLLWRERICSKCAQQSCCPWSKLTSWNLVILWKNRPRAGCRMALQADPGIKFKFSKTTDCLLKKIKAEFHFPFRVFICFYPNQFALWIGSPGIVISYSKTQCYVLYFIALVLQSLANSVTWRVCCLSVRSCSVSEWAGKPQMSAHSLEPFICT